MTLEMQAVICAVCCASFGLGTISTSSWKVSVSAALLNGLVFIIASAALKALAA